MKAPEILTWTGEAQRAAAVGRGRQLTVGARGAQVCRGSQASAQSPLSLPGHWRPAWSWTPFILYLLLHPNFRLDSVGKEKEGERTRELRFFVLPRPGQTCRPAVSC